MATWSVKPEWKKSIIERNYLVKGDNRIMIETGWRWGEFHVYTDDDNPPNLEPGVDMFDCGYESEMIETNDGCWEEFDFDECDPETEEQLIEFFDEGNSWMDLEEEGWMHDECEMIIDCDLIIERVDGDTEQVIHTSKTDEGCEPCDDSDCACNKVDLEAPAKWPFDRPYEGPKE